MAEQITFGDAVEALKMGKKVVRLGWNGDDMHIKMQFPDSGSKMTLPYIYMKTAQGEIVPWIASQSDIISEDWIVII